MFSEQSIAEVMKLPRFLADVGLVRESLSKLRIGQHEMFAAEAVNRLAYFVEAVLASAPDWRNGASGPICKRAAEISETLANHSEIAQISSKRFRLRSALLYELAAYPAIAQAILEPL